jgi:hypothetical protein
MLSVFVSINSTCVTTVVPLPYPMTLGNGAARQLVPELAGGGVDDAFYAQSESGISVCARKRGVIGWAVMTGSLKGVREPVVGVVEMAQRGRRRDRSSVNRTLEAILGLK